MGFLDRIIGAVNSSIPANGPSQGVPGGHGAPGTPQDRASQAAAAQQFANEQLHQAGYTGPEGMTQQNAAGAQQRMQADHDLLNAYGQELNRIIAVGTPGTAQILERVDTGERTAGTPWYLLTLEVRLPDRGPYTVQKREYIGPQTLGMFAPGTTRPVAVDPVDANRVAFSG